MFLRSFLPRAFISGFLTLTKKHPKLSGKSLGANAASKAPGVVVRRHVLAELGVAVDEGAAHFALVRLLLVGVDGVHVVLESDFLDEAFFT